MEAGNLEQLFERIRTTRPNAVDLSDDELAMLAAWLDAYRAPQLRLSQLRDERRRGITTYRDEINAEKAWIRHLRFVLGYNPMRRATAPVPVDGHDPPAAQAHSDTEQYPNSVGPEPGVTWRQYVDEQHRHMEACAPPGWEGLLAHDQPRTFADVGPWLRRELASLLLMGEKSRDEFWLERANELLRNAYRLLDMFKVWGAPEQPGPLNDWNDIERAIRSLAEWCQRQNDTSPPATKPNLSQPAMQEGPAGDIVRTQLPVNEVSMSHGTAEQPMPKNYLRGRREILGALELKNNDEKWGELVRLNDAHGGPIIRGGQGQKPTCEKQKLIEWWNKLEDILAQQQARERDKKATVDARHSYGRDGDVVPGIHGGVKKRRGPSK